MADHNIDSLNIKITSDARSANNALNSLEKHLDKLASSLTSLGAQSAGLTQFSAGVTELSNAMINFKNSGIGTADFTRLVKNLGQVLLQCPCKTLHTTAVMVPHLQADKPMKWRILEYSAFSNLLLV